MVQSTPPAVVGSPVSVVTSAVSLPVSVEGIVVAVSTVVPVVVGGVVPGCGSGVGVELVGTSVVPGEDDVPQAHISRQMDRTRTMGTPRFGGPRGSCIAAWGAKPRIR